MIQDLYIVRHGETDYNRRHIVQGRGVNASLNEKGRKQSRQFYEAYAGLPLNHVFVSSLRRSLETAEPFAEQGVPVSRHADLDEIDWGEREGLRATAAMRAEYRRILDGWHQGALSVSLPGGESPLDVRDRLTRFLEYWESRNLSCSLIVGHGRAMRVLLCLLLERPLEHMVHFEHGNLGLYHLQRNRSQTTTFTMLLRNSDQHLRLSNRNENG